ncbi:MAG: hypothetical protein KIT84_23795 [Labilithrix sp.]|nr:hypothetical protein [Labilithrix sp.]MCW5814072.1 hypothetical protein [Labilithrix sp.]
MKRAAITIGIAALLSSPLARPVGWDDFPISSYPMFSRDIGRTATLAHALVVQADGGRAPAAPSLVGTPEPMVAGMIVMRAIDGGTARALCAGIAARATEGVAIEIVTSEFDSTRYFQDDERAPLARTVHARCDVPRRP